VTIFINVKDIIRKILKESFDDDLSWIRNTEIPKDVMNFFIPGKQYNMEILHNPQRSLDSYITFEGYKSGGTGGPYDDGRGSLLFDKTYIPYSYSPLYIETRLGELGLTLYDLEFRK
jgi:hypothetical protein